VTEWPDLHKPARLTDRTAADWFARIAADLLNRTRWIIGGRPHRITEVEFYFRGHEHDDPFTHGDPIQVHQGRWYFHKTAGAYRGGTFKGVDVTCGDGTARGGILIRGVAEEDGSLIDGPSLLVDRVLRSCDLTSVRALDQAIADRVVWDPSGPMYLEPAADTDLPILATARVGLSLRRAGKDSTKPAYLTRPYRFLTDPRAIAKGKPHMVMALYRQRRSPDEIRSITGVPARSIAAYVAAYEAGLSDGQWDDYFGKEIGPLDVCRFHGIADRR
jgi:hypothetical protein